MVVAQCDNPAVVSVLNSGYYQDKKLMHMLQWLFSIEAHSQFKLTAVHLPGVYSELADDLSQNRLSAFLCKLPSADPASSHIPPSLLQWLCLRNCSFLVFEGYSSFNK